MPSARPTLKEYLKAQDQEASIAAQLADARLEVKALQREVAGLRGRLASTSPQPQTILVIGDAHSDPLADNDRFTWLGRAICDLRPQVVVDIGDWATLGSLYHGDWGKMRGEGKRLADDIAWAVEARARVQGELARYNKGRRVKYTPTLISTLGNHEDRLVKTVERSPHLHGTLRLEDLGHAAYGWEPIPHNVPHTLAGITFQHHFTSAGGRPLASEKHHAAQLLDKGLQSSVMGHSHRFDLSIRRRWDGTRALGLVAGCYFSHVEPWAGPDNENWHRGLVLLRDVVNGYGEVEFIGMDRIRRTYSDDGA